MGYQQRARTPRDFGRRPGRTTSKAKSGKRREESGAYRSEEEHVLTFEKVVDRTVNSLTRLGSQRFGVPPFYGHFDRWLVNLQTIMSEFQTSPTIHVDDQFTKESSQILSDIEVTLKERRLKEASREEAIRKNSQDLLEARSLLAQTEREYVIRTKESEAKKELAIKPVAGTVGRLREELNRIARMRAGFLRSISKKTKAQKEAETSQRLNSTKSELAKIKQSFVPEQEKLRKEYKERKQRILEQIANQQKNIEILEAGSEIDDAVGIRRAACDALVNDVNSLLQRNVQTSETTNPPEQ